MVPDLSNTIPTLERTGPIDVAEEIDISLREVSKMVDLLNGTTCEKRTDDMLKKYPERFPPTFNNTEFWGCKGYPELCCFHPNDPEDGKRLIEAFKFVYAGSLDIIYRLHYKGPRDQKVDEDDDAINIKFNTLSMVFRICLDKKNCPDGQTPPAIDIPDPSSSTSKKSKTKTKSESKTRSTDNKMTSTVTATVTVTTTKPTTPTEETTSSLMTNEAFTSTSSTGNKTPSRTQQTEGPRFSILPVHDALGRTVESSHPESTNVAPPVPTDTSKTSSSPSQFPNQHFSEILKASTLDSEDDFSVVFDSAKADAGLLANLILEGTDLSDWSEAEAHISFKLNATGALSPHTFPTLVDMETDISGQLTSPTEGTFTLRTHNERLDKQALVEALSSATQVKANDVRSVFLEWVLDAVCAVGGAVVEPDCTSMNVKIRGHSIPRKTPSKSKTGASNTGKHTAPVTLSTTSHITSAEASGREPLTKLPSSKAEKRTCTDKNKGPWSMTTTKTLSAPFPTTAMTIEYKIPECWPHDETFTHTATFSTSSKGKIVMTSTQFTTTLPDDADRTIKTSKGAPTKAPQITLDVV